MDDYELLQKLNELTKQKYIEMDDVTKGLTTRMEQINKKCKYIFYGSVNPTVNAMCILHVTIKFTGSFY